MTETAGAVPPGIEYRDANPLGLGHRRVRRTGVEFASLLAARGYNLVLAARSLDRLQAVAAELRPSGVQIHVERSDLGERDAVTALVTTIRERGIRLDVLVAKAGQGRHGDFAGQSTDAIDRMLQLDIASLTGLTHAVAADMAERGTGHILLIASMTAFMPCPIHAVDAATKAHVRSLGEALHFELAPRDVGVTVLSPGLIDTGFLNASGQEPSKSTKRAMTSPRATGEMDCTPFEPDRLDSR